MKTQNKILEFFLSNLEFQSFIQKLQSDGWLDWQLLGAIKSIVISYRVKKDLSKFSNASELKDYILNKSRFVLVG